MTNNPLNLSELDKVNLNHSENVISIKEDSIKEIAVIGMAVKMPGASKLDEFWQSIRNGVDAINEFPEARRKDIEQFLHDTGIKEHDYGYANGAYLQEIADFDYEFFNITPNEACLMDPNQRLFLQTVWEAIEDAGYGGNNLSGTKTGVYVGYIGNLTGTDYKQLISATIDAPLTTSLLGNLASVISGRVSYLLDLNGPSMLLDTACSSSLVALHLACQSLRNRESEYAIVGSIRVNLAPLGYHEKLGIESSDGRARTFDDHSNGTGMGEGVVAVLLKPLNKSLKDGDQIHAIIKGSAVNQDGRSLGLSAPNVLAQKNVILNAWKNAGINPETISYIETHGTGTKLGDPIEIDAIQRAFRVHTDKKQFCAVGSIKTNIGHLGEAAGLTSLVKAILMLKNKEIPPILHFSRPNRAINFPESPVYVNDRLRNWEGEGFPRRCGVSAFGLSGTNCHVILEEAPEFKGKEDATDKELYIFTLSAKNPDILNKLIRDYLNYFNSGAPKLNIKNICYTASAGRGHYNYRLAIVVKDVEDLKENLVEIKDFSAECKYDRIFYGEHWNVPEYKVARKNNEISVEEGREKSRLADLKIGEYLQDKNNSDILYEICALYTSGAGVDWKKLYRSKEVHKVSLPVYPFAKKKCWIDLREIKKQTSIQNNPVTHINLKGRENGKYTQPEVELAIIWKEILGFEEINIYDNLYELGGDSIQAAQISSKVNERMKITTSVAEFLKYPSIVEFAGCISEKRQSPHMPDEPDYNYISNPIVSLLNEKKEKSIFAFPPILGFGVSYLNLAKQILDYSVYGFDYIEDIDKIQKYVQQITNIQEKGPYILMGFSAGGILAFEVAKELIRLDHPVAGIILLDTMPLKKVHWFVNEKIYLFLLALILIFKGKYFKYDLKRKVLSYTQFQFDKKIYTEKVDADIYMIKTPLTIRKYINGWNALTEKTFVTLTGHGLHSGMINPGNIEKNADIVKKILETL